MAKPVQTKSFGKTTLKKFIWKFGIYQCNQCPSTFEDHAVKNHSTIFLKEEEKCKTCNIETVLVHKRQCSSKNVNLHSKEDPCNKILGKTWGHSLQNIQSSKYYQKVFFVNSVKNNSETIIACKCSFSGWLEQCFLTVGQNDFRNEIPNFKNAVLVYYSVVAQVVSYNQK